MYTPPLRLQMLTWQIGGAIGTLFCLALTLGSSLYVLGAVETILTGFDTGGPHDSDSGVAQVSRNRKRISEQNAR